MNGSRLTPKKRPLLILLMAVAIIILWLPSQLLAYSFHGTVIHDSLAGISSGDPVQTFTGSLSPGGGSLIFDPSYGSHTYNNPGDLLWGGFTQGGVNYSYVFSRGKDSPGIRMGVIWWALSPSTTLGIAFHLEGSYLTLGDMANYNPDNPGVGFAGVGFLGFISSGQFPIIPITPTNQSQVPLPASLWFLGCGLLVVWRRLKK